MSMLNIPSYNDDPNYRYKMPKLLSKVEGRGNGVRTNIMNMAEIARALKRPPEYPSKFCGHELGSSSKFDPSEGKAIVNGSHEMSALQQLIDKFVEKYVLCPTCNLPEIDLVVKKSRVGCTCNACGYSGDLDNSHKLASFMAKYPPGGESTMGKKLKSAKHDRKDKKPGSKDDGTDAAATQEEVKPKKSSSGGSKEKKPKVKSKKKEEDADKDSADGDSDENAPAATSSKEKKKKKEKESKSVIIAKEALTFNSPEVVDVISIMKNFVVSGDSSKQIPQKPLTFAVTPSQYFEELRQLQMSQDFTDVIAFYVTLRVFFPDVKCVENFEIVLPYFATMLGEGSGMSTTKICNAFEAFFDSFSEKESSETKKHLSLFPIILHKLHEEDFLDEDDLLSYYGAKITKKGDKAPKQPTEPYTLAKKAVEPFLIWLQDVESDEEDGSLYEEASPKSPPVSQGLNIKPLEIGLPKSVVVSDADLMTEANDKMVDSEVKSSEEESDIDIDDI